MRILLFSFFLLLTTVVCSQNLVPNPSFEEYVDCPIYIGDLSVLHWFSPTNANPDYFNECNQGSVGVPQNAFGWQYANSGAGYVGGHTSNFGTSEYREYIQCELDSILESGVMYLVSFYVSRADSSTKACDNIGAHLSQEPISSTSNGSLGYFPQLVSPSQQPVENAEAWIQLVDTIVATGGERFLTIGVFTDNANTFWIDVEGGWEEEAHYYYDDVVVRRIVPNDVESIRIEDIKCYPNPTYDRLFIRSSNVIDRVIVHSSIDKIVRDEQPMVRHHFIDLKGLVNGWCVISVYSNSKVTRQSVFLQ